MNSTTSNDDALLFAYKVDARGRLVSGSSRILKAAAEGRADDLVRHAVPLPASAVASFRARRANGTLSPAEDRAIGAVIGMAVGDALGAPLEFMHYRKNGQPPTIGMGTLPGQQPPSVSGMGVILPGQSTCDAFSLSPGQWTDDTAMGLCLADSLLQHSPLDPLDLLLRFVAWWDLGYNNAFGADAARADKTSVGLGGTISMSLDAFKETGDPYTNTGNADSSGNGCLMRLAPVAVAFHGDENAAAAAARLQCRTTHRGDEAAECSALLASAIVRFIHAPGSGGDRGGNSAAAAAAGSGDSAAAAARCESVLRSLVRFSSTCPSVLALAKGKAETKRDGSVDPDRNWAWRSENYEYSPSRAARSPGYIGSYAMDALSMALHCVWATDSFEEAVLLAVNMRGDADSVGAITGQLAGALYGLSAIPAAWVAAVERWDGGGSIADRAYCLFARANGAAASTTASSAAATSASVAGGDGGTGGPSSSSAAAAVDRPRQREHEQSSSSPSS